MARVQYIFIKHSATLVYFLNSIHSLCFFRPKSEEFMSLNWQFLLNDFFFSLNLEFSYSFPGFSFSGLDLVFKSNFQTWDSLHISIQSNLSGRSVHIALHRNTYLSIYIHNNYGIWLLFANYKQLM